jgi:hypothetical protein
MNLQKDFFNVSEAAVYCGVSESQFRRKSNENCLAYVPFMGKKLYKRADLARAIESKLMIL